MFSIVINGAISSEKLLIVFCYFHLTLSVVDQTWSKYCYIGKSISLLNSRNHTYPLINPPFLSLDFIFLDNVLWNIVSNGRGCITSQPKITTRNSYPRIFPTGYFRNTNKWICGSLGVDCNILSLSKLTLGVSGITWALSSIQFLSLRCYSLKYFSNGSIFLFACLFFTVKECPMNTAVSPNYWACWNRETSRFYQMGLR